MNNYQLYRTNVALGGQLKWDISVDNGSNGLYVSDFHITPISRRVPYNRYAQDHLLNYSHLENIKSFYKDIEGSFYQPYADPVLVNEQPYLFKKTPGHETMDLHVDTFDMGVQRAQYSVYRKTFEAFCPVWLEDMYDKDGIKPLTFKFYLRNKTASGKIVDVLSKSLTLDFSQEGTDIHSRFVSYLGNYIRNIQLDDRIIKIDFDKQGGVMTGIDASTGLVKTVDISGLTRDMLSQERLLMETDGMIIDRFATNHMIAKQLFNFNFVFDIEEFFSPQILKLMKGEDIYLDIRVYVDDKELEIKDFYTNYDKIYKDRVSGIFEGPAANISVFDDLCDNKNVDLITKNKMIQSICHWSLANNNDYIFNLYDGFAGYITRISDTDTWKLTRINRIAPDIWSDKYDELLNNLGWLNVCTIHNWSEYADIEQNIDQWKSNASPISEWVNMCRYGASEIEALQEYVSYAAIVIIRSNISPERTRLCWDKVKQFAIGDYDIKLDTGDGNIVVKYIKSAHMLLLITCEDEASSLDSLTFAGFRNLIENSDHVILKPLHEVMNSVEQPKVITFDKTLGFMRADGPSIKSTELDHYKIKSNKKLFRLDGYIKPSFVSPIMNTLYTKIQYVMPDQKQDFDISAFAKYTELGYPAHYSSLAYYPFVPHDLSIDQNDELGRVIKEDSELFVSQNLPYEYKWFTLSKLLLVDREINIRLTGDGSKTVKDLILDYLKEKYDTSEDQAYYIYDLYNMTYDWEYLSPTEIDKYIYTIKLVLK